MKRILIAVLVLLSALTYPAKAQAPVWSVTLTLNNATEWIMVVSRDATEMVRLEVRKLPGGQEKAKAREVAQFILRELGDDIGTELRRQFTDQLEAGIR